MFSLFSCNFLSYSAYGYDEYPREYHSNLKSILIRFSEDICIETRLNTDVF